jgi:hypothetical protein
MYLKISAAYIYADYDKKKIYPLFC